MKEPTPYPALVRVVRAHRRPLLLLFVGVLLPLYLFGELAETVWSAEPLSWDDAVLLWMYRLSTPIADGVMLMLSRLGYAYGVIPIDIGVSTLLLLRRRWFDAIFFGLAVGGAAALNVLAKALFGRERPALWDVIAPEMSYSFPSAHAMGSMALVAALAVLAWPTRWRWLALGVGSLFTFLVGVSRVYLGVHYPSDVLAGWAAALAWVVGLSLVLYGYRACSRPAVPPDATDYTGGIQAVDPAASSGVERYETGYHQEKDHARD